MTDAADAPARTRRRALPWVAGVAILLLFAAWLVVGKNPSLEFAGASWQSGAFVPADPNSDDFDEPTSWVAWDQPDGAWASVTVRNNRPYPVTISDAENGPAVEVQLAAHDPLLGSMDVPGPLAAATDRVTLATGEHAVVAMRVSDACIQLGPGNSVGAGAVILNVTSFGITAPVEVEFPGTYLAGSTTGHTADPSCAGE